MSRGTRTTLQAPQWMHLARNLAGEEERAVLRRHGAKWRVGYRFLALDEAKGLPLLIAAAGGLRLASMGIDGQQLLPGLVQGSDLCLNFRKQASIPVVPFELLKGIVSQPIGGVDHVVDVGHMAR